MRTRFVVRNLDFGFSDGIQNFFELLEKHNATLGRIISRGPAGGNPRLELFFDSFEDVESFLWGYVPSPAELSLYPIHTVEGDLDEVTNEHGWILNPGYMPMDVGLGEHVHYRLKDGRIVQDVVAAGLENWNLIRDVPENAIIAYRKLD